MNPKEASKHFRVSEQTLRTWANNGQIKYTTTKGGHRRYVIECDNTAKRNYIYARVSSKKQQGDLERQIQYLKDRYPDHEIETDIGSGINWKRPGFRRILDLVFERNIGEVVVASSDRFSRIGTEVFEWIFQRFGAQLISINDESKEELTDDLMEIITVFTARYYGKRKYSSKKNKILSESSSEEIYQ